MTTDDLSWMADWTVGVRVWLERGGQAVLGEGGLQLLEGIDRCRSISAAARQAGISYRHAWVMVQEVNRGAGEPLVEAVTGGRHGGGSRLTPRGRLAVATFRGVQERLRRSASCIRAHPSPDSASAGVRVAAAVSLEEVLGRLLANYAQEAPGLRVRTVFGALDELADHILEAHRSICSWRRTPANWPGWRGWESSRPERPSPWQRTPWPSLGRTAKAWP